MDDEEERKYSGRGGGRKNKTAAKMSDMMRQGQSTMSIFEQMYMQSLKEVATPP